MKKGNAKSTKGSRFTNVEMNLKETDTLPPLSPSKRNENDERKHAKDRLTTPPPTNGEIMQRILKQDAPVQASPNVVPKPKVGYLHIDC